MTSLLFTDKAIKYTINIKDEEVQNILPITLKFNPPRDALIIQTNESIMVYTPDDKVLHPANRIRLNILHMFEKEGMVTCITPQGQFTFKITKKETLFNLTGSKGTFYPNLVDTKKFIVPVESACGNEQIYLLHSNRNLTIINQRPIMYQFNLPKGRIYSYQDLFVVITQCQSIFYRMTDGDIKQLKVVDNCVVVAIGRKYIYCGVRDVLTIYEKTDEMDIVKEIELSTRQYTECLIRQRTI